MKAIIGYPAPQILYILFAGYFTAMVLDEYSAHITMLAEPKPGREMIIAFGQLLFQGVFIVQLGWEPTLKYLGHLMTASLGGALLLLPILLLNMYCQISQATTIGWFGVTAGLMFFEHYRRVKCLELPGYLCLTWVAYRLIVLIIITAN